MTKTMICGQAFEELTNDEMQDIDGGWTTVFTCTTLPCGVGASISTIAVSIYYNVK